MKKIILAVLLAAMLTGTLASCGSASSDALVTTAADGTTQAATEADVQTSALDMLPDEDFGGYAFRIMDRSSEASSTWCTIDVFASETNGDPINDAVYERNRAVEEKYNVTIVEDAQKDSIAAIQKSVAAGDDVADLVTSGLAYLVNLIPQKMIYSLNDIENLNLSSSYWDEELLSGMSVANRTYFATGDISIMDNEGTWCVLFNKDIVENFGMDNPYTLVSDGSWTFDTFASMALAGSSDLDGDGEMTISDQWGFLTERYNIYALWAASGEMIITKDNDDLPVDTMMGDRSVSVFDKIIELHFNDRVSAIMSGTIMKQYEDITNTFSGGRALFEYGAMGLISDYRATDVNFGILPAPKFDEAQSRYYNSFSYANFTAYAIPVTVGDVERTGLITEALAAASVSTLTPAYYETSLKGKFVRDTESSDMLDLILSTRSFDLGLIYNWAGSFSLFNDATSKDGGAFASKYAKIQTKLDTEITKFIESIAE